MSARRPGGGRIYHPSPNCPCPSCVLRFHGTTSSSHKLSPQPAKKRLIKVLDFPPADRAVLLQIITRYDPPTRNPGTR